MKISKYVKMAFLSIVCIYSINSIIAVAPEFLGLNSTQAKILATRYKDEALRNPMLPHHVHLAPLKISTDTDLLLKGITDGHNAEYVAFAKRQIKVLVGNWIDGLLVGDAKFVVSAVTTASLNGSNRNKSTFNFRGRTATISHRKSHSR